MSASVMVLGDSTGANTYNWPYTFGAQVVPAGCQVMYKIFNDTTQDYGAWTVIQAGTTTRNGVAGEPNIRFPSGTLAQRIQFPATVGAPASDIDVRIKVSLDDWTPAALNTLMAYFGAAGNRSWRFYVNTAGSLFFEWTADGTTIISSGSTALGFTDGSTNWVRATLDVDNGGGGYTLTYYKSTDGVTWTTIGTPVTTSAGTTSLYTPTGINYVIGTANGGSPLIGNVYEAQIRDGIGGPIMNEQPIENWHFTSSTFDDGAQSPIQGSPTLYVVNGSVSGQGLDYFNDTTRFPKMTPKHPSAVLIVNTSKNDSLYLGDTLKTKLDTLTAAIAARQRFVSTCFMAQNPNISPATPIEMQAIRTREMAQYAKSKGYSVIDVCRAFYEDSRGIVALTNAADGKHPSVPAGADLATSVVVRAFTAGP